MTSSRKIYSSDDPGVVNEILMSKWGVSIFNFAQVFAVSPADLILLRNDYPFSSKEISVIRRNLKAMKEDLLYRGRIISEITNKLWESPKKLSDDELIKYMRLESFFSKYVSNQEKAISYASTMSLHGKRGTAINHKSIIAVGWGNLISGRSRRMDWQTLGDLYYWFWEKVSHYEFYKKLRPSEGIEEYLRHQYVRYRWTRKDVLERAGKNIRVVFNLISNLLSQQFLGNQNEYIKDKLGLNESEFPAFFLNLIVDYSLSGHEGLTIFSRNQAISDPLYLFLKARLGKSVANKAILSFLSWMFPGELPDPKNQELPYRSSEIREYLDIAVNIYRGNRISLKRPVPLIIFPDRSFFSTSF
jgi:hypothetical protein